MPKLGAEPIRRAALVKATIAEIGATGSLDVTVARIAKRAGMSSALAHHYFGGKDQIFLAALREILRDYSAEVRGALRAATSPRARAEALIDANFAASCFDPATVSAWMTLYAQATTSPDMHRLLQVYQRRLHSNLVHALRPFSSDPHRDAQVLGALIDGLYLRCAYNGGEGVEAARQIARETLARLTGGAT